MRKQIPRVEIYDLMPVVEPEIKTNKSDNRYWLVCFLIITYGFLCSFRDWWNLLSLIPFVFLLYLLSFKGWLK